MQLEDLSNILVPSHLFASVGLGVLLLLALLALQSWSAPTDARGKHIPSSGFADYGLYSAFTCKMADFAGLGTRYGPVFHTYFLGKPMIFISGAANVRAVLNAPHDEVQASLPSSLGALLGNDNLMFLHGKAHTHQRRLLLHAFTPTNLKGYIARLGALADSTVAEWASTGVISGHKSVRKYVIQVAAELLMGFDARWTSPEEFERVNQLYLDIWNGFFSLHIDLPGTAYHKAMKSRKELFQKISKSLQDIIDRRTKEKLEADQKKNSALTPPTAASANNNNTNNNETSPQGRSVVEVLLNTVDEDGNSLKHDRIVAAATALLIGAVDTTSSTLMMAIRFLALHPEVLQKLQEEQINLVKRVVSEQEKDENNELSESFESFTDAAMRMMPYTDAILKETLRLQSPSRVVFRKAVADYEVAGYVIPAGRKILINLGESIAHDERWVNDSPELFRPERWLSEEGQRVGAWVPFGGGSRLCLGQQLAWLEMKAVLAALGRGGYELELLDKEEKWKTFPLMLPAKGMMLRVSVCEPGK